MDTDALLLSQIQDKINQCGEQSVITCSSFLNEHELSLAIPYCRKHADMHYFIYGGFAECERNILLFFPYYLDLPSDEEKTAYLSENEDENPLCLLRFAKDAFSPPLSHRDYLGALMGLGLRRGLIGDITVSENGADIIVFKKIAAHILQNLTSVGRATVKGTVTNIDDTLSNNVRYLTKTITASSLRLDNILSACYNFTRSESTDMIQKGLVFVNGVQNCKKDDKIRQGDKISLRGKGKFMLEEIAGTTKKGRQKMIIKLFI